MFGRWQEKLRSLRVEVHALWLAYRHPGTPWYAKLVAACVLAYALSPIDLIPDFIPVVGHLDDIVLVPAGLFLAFKLVPADVLAECRERAGDAADRRRPIGWLGAAVVAAVWLALLFAAGWMLLRALGE
jgi:uncharacterized membrane protein YkvA (DUF1232 family)